MRSTADVDDHAVAVIASESLPEPAVNESSVRVLEPTGMPFITLTSAVFKEVVLAPGFVYSTNAIELDGLQCGEKQSPFVLYTCVWCSPVVSIT